MMHVVNGIFNWPKDKLLKKAYKKAKNGALSAVGKPQSLRI